MRRQGPTDRIRARQAAHSTGGIRVAQSPVCHRQESIGMVEGERRVDGKTEQETHYYISSLSGEAEEFGYAVRSHWGIENCVHWVLDIAFRLCQALAGR
ncbi:MAG: ISAs1 family transposase [Chloroflexota bacterium]|nr:ISAs1 family transposase [Chloroflexota bacterium]